MNAAASISPGANEPAPLRDDALFAVRDVLREFTKRRDEILAAARSYTVAKNRAGAGDITDVVGTAQKVWKLIEERRDRLIAPYREAATVVRSNVGEFWADVDVEMERLTGLVAAFEDAEKARIRQQQIEQQREQERLRAAAAPAPSSPPRDSAPVETTRPIRGAYGSKTAKTKTVEIRVVDVTKVPLAILNAPRVHEAIAAVARDFARHQDAIDGLEIVRGAKTAIRSA